MIFVVFKIRFSILYLIFEIRVSVSHKPKLVKNFISILFLYFINLLFFQIFLVIIISFSILSVANKFIIRIQLTSNPYDYSIHTCLYFSHYHYSSIAPIISINSSQTVPSLAISFLCYHFLYRYQI